MLDARLPDRLRSRETAAPEFDVEGRLADATASECLFFAVAATGMTTDGSADLEKRGAVVAVSQFSDGSREVEGASVEEDERVEVTLDAGEAGREGGGWSSSTSSSFNGFKDDSPRRLEGGDDDLDGCNWP